jgi:anti-sigma factor RsiW
MSAREETPPSADELQAMAYVDGELVGENATRFQARLASEPALAREVAELRALELIARQVAPPEPIDYEWARIDTDPLQRAASGLGFTLAVVGTVGFWLWLAWQVVSGDIPLVPRALILSTGGGLGIVFLTILRRRLQSLPYDPYTKVKR